MKKTVEFGRYFVNSREMAEIEWIVLEETKDNKALLLCKDCIEAMHYEYEENSNRNPNWENGVIRAWLNGYFLDLCFTIREKKKMNMISITTPDGNVLNDKVVLLSAQEVERYLPEEKDRKAKPTARAKRKVEGERLYIEKGNCSWFLRDPSNLIEGNSTDVSVEGKIDLYGGDFYRGGVHGIRPVILVDL